MDVIMLIIWVLIFLLGAAFGSFANVVALRFAKGEEAVGRSHCPHCHAILQWYDLIPVISFFLLRRRCRYCQAVIPMQYVATEIVCGIALVTIMMQFPISIVIPTFTAFCVLIILFLTDLKTFLLPDFFLIILAVSAIANLIIAPTLNPESISTGIVSGAGFLLFLWVITRGQGIGLGDVKLMIPLGLMFGLQGIIPLLFSAFIIGGVYGTYLIITKKAGPKTPIPFGPFLAGISMMFLVFPTIVPAIWHFILPSIYDMMPL